MCEPFIAGDPKIQFLNKALHWLDLEKFNEFAKKLVS